MLRRYRELSNWVDMIRPRSIVEVGAWSGEQAVRMIRTASKYYPQIRYTGFDVFELGDSELDAKEFNGKSRVTEEGTRATIEGGCPDAIVRLVKGNTLETLREKVSADFAYIDGGHSVETIANDYRACADCPVVIFDDYYFNLNPDADIDLARFGCNTLIDELATRNDPDLIVGTFPTFDHFDHLGSITMAFVAQRGSPFAAQLVSRCGKVSGYLPPEKSEIIEAVCQGLLGRPSDRRVQDIWLDRLEWRGIDLMLMDFVNTEEFKSRFRKKHDL